MNGPAPEKDNAMFDIVYHLRQRRDTLSPVERRIADAILRDISAASQLGIAELAARAQVSVAAISRFAKSLGCDNVRELRARLAEASAVGKRFLDEPDAPPVSALYAQICSDIEVTLRRNLGGLKEPEVQAAAEALAGARMVHAFGMGGASTVFAAEVQNRLGRLGRPVSACSDAVAMRMLAATLGPEDVVLALSITGITAELLTAIEVARSYGARVVAITRAGTPLAARADWLLPIVIDETDFVFKPTASRYAVMLAIDILATTLALHQPTDNRERLRRIKLALDASRGGDDRLPLGD
ncbi:MurR/RpiR family transcriptional regulator [Pseudoxanthomonas sp.]|uniref:MurR/RpiR family transcriptional regulator n=1 Tax=Pseudoxanthomonas sp. TaxID=1871049 RepID=UPI00258F2B17|nr:MurR/RpiR family transcriptional regulator [Pseudoxanthomonas sp.]MCR6686744.1 MurR/RpiR family transcriptional regulator [Pseudoxanthomonas sp.]